MIKRKLTVFIIAFLIVALVIPTFLSYVSSSVGSIKINSTTTSPLGQQVQAGGSVNLYFGGVTWSSDSLYLFLSQDGISQISSGDFVYSPAFSIYDIISAVAKTYSQDNYTWVAGNNWINGSIPTTLALGNYFVKAVDQVFSTVAVTDTSFKVNSINYNSALTISPPSGPGGVDIALTGTQFPPNSLVSISYYDPSFGTWNYFASTTADATGQIQVNSQVPDLMGSLRSGDCLETFNTIRYRAEINGITYSYANYNEYLRGLKTVGNQTANGLYGNGTNLVSTLKALVGDTISLSGKWFHPGVVYIRWDSFSVVGTVTSSQWLNANIIGQTVANSVGSFSTTVAIPQNVEAGEHYLAIEDSQTRLIVKIFVSTASLQLSPAFGPGGATVQFSGSGYPASTSIGIYYKDPSFGTWSLWTTATSDSTGLLSLNGEMPDLRKSAGSGDYGNTSSLISFRTQVNSVAYSYADFIEYGRGLSNVGNQFAHGLFGNGTNLASSVSVKPGDSIAILGKWFHPGVVYIRFDGIAVVGTVTSDEWRNAQIIGTTSASQTGSFSTIITIPSASGGEHYLRVEDSQTNVIIKININGPVIATPIPTAAPTPAPTPVPTPNPSLPTPVIDLSCRSTTTVSGFKVEINGNVSLNGHFLTDQPVLISYSVTGGKTWQSLTLVKTLSQGQFVAVWTPSVTGNYLVKATVEKSSTMNEAANTVNLALTPDANQNVFTLTSNSTITQFAYNSTTQELSFIASGPSDTQGYVDLYIPKTLLSDISTLKAYVDGNEVTYTSESQADSWLISFTYHHSQHTITMAIGAPLKPISNTSLTSQWIIYVAIACVVAAIAVTALAFKQRNRKTYSNLGSR